jgi:DNA processing protein
VITALDQDRVARAVLTYLAEPGDPVLAALLQVSTPADLVAAVAARRLPAVPARCWDAIRGTGRPGGRSRTDTARLEHAFGTWRKRLGSVPAEMDLAGFHRDGIRLVCPGEPEWPTQLDMLGLGRPYALWLRGEADLRYCCLRSVSIVGARAATAYGAHVGTEMAAALAERGWTVVSGGAYGIDSCAHRGALAADGVTIAVLACGVDVAYPAGHADLLTAIAAQGVLVSEWPPGRTPTRRRFLIRNRVIGALSRGTVVVEAGLRSGALNTARHARDLGRPLMAVPGPVTSAVSAGCHRVIREWAAVCVTSAADVVEMLTPLGESDLDRTSGAPGNGPGPPRPGVPGHVPFQESLWSEAPGRSETGPAQAGPAQAGPAQAGTAQAGRPSRGPGPLLARDALDGQAIAVLDAIPVRGAGPATIAVAAGLSVDAAVRSQGLLAAGGYVERCSRGWRLRRSAS